MDNKKIIKYYEYKFVKNVEPFNIFGEMIFDEDEDKKYYHYSIKNVNSYKKENLLLYVIKIQEFYI